MKIAFAIFKYFPWGGLQKDFLRMAAEVAARGHETVCFTGSWEGDIPSFLDVRILPLKKHSNHARAEEFEELFAQALEKEHFDRSVTCNRIGGADVYFAGDDCFAAAFAKRKNPILSLLPRYKIFLRQEKSILEPNSKTHILYLEERQKADYIRIYGTQEERFTLLPPAGDPRCMYSPETPAIRNQKRLELNIKEDQYLLISVAADFHCKGIDRTIQAFAALPENLRKQCVLCLIGGNDLKRRETFIQQAERLGVAQQTIFAGSRDDVYAFLAAADLMVHPARKEAAGAVIAEALASGIPVICSGICGYAPLIGKAGNVIPEPFDMVEFQKLLEKSLNELPQLKEQAMKTAGQMDVSKRTACAADVIIGQPDRSAE